MPPMELSPLFSHFHGQKWISVAFAPIAPRSYYSERLSVNTFGEFSGNFSKMESRCNKNGLRLITAAWLVHRSRPLRFHCRYIKFVVYRIFRTVKPTWHWSSLLVTLEPTALNTLSSISEAARPKTVLLVVLTISFHNSPTKQKRNTFF